MRDIQPNGPLVEDVGHQRLTAIGAAGQCLNAVLNGFKCGEHRVIVVAVGEMRAARIGDGEMKVGDTTWASVNQCRRGRAVLIGAVVSDDRLVDVCPDNASWISNLIALLTERSRETAG